MKAKKTAEQYGDIKADDPIGKPLTDFFLLELKRGYNLDINFCTLIDCPKDMKPPIMVGWYKKMEEERIWANRKASLLMFKRDRRDAIVMMGLGTLHILEKKILMDLDRNPFGYFRCRWTEDILVFMRLKDFLATVHPKDIIDLIGSTPTPRVRA